MGVHRLTGYIEVQAGGRSHNLFLLIYILVVCNVWDPKFP
jgi:hypothetical protein